MSSTAVGSKSRTRMVVAPCHSPQYAHPIPPMWNIGRGVRLTDRSSNAQRREVCAVTARLPMRGEHALRDTGRAGCVHLDDHVAGAAAAARIARLVGREPALVGLAHDDQVRRRRQPLQHVLGDLAVCGAGDQHRRLRVRHHRGQLGRRQPPVQRHEHRAGLARREQQLDHLGRRAVEVGDARAGAHAARAQRLREPVRALVEVSVDELPLAVAERHRLGRRSAWRRMTSATRTSGSVKLIGSPGRTA